MLYNCIFEAILNRAFKERDEARVHGVRGCDDGDCCPVARCGGGGEGGEGCAEDELGYETEVVEEGGEVEFVLCEVAVAEDVFVEAFVESGWWPDVLA
ncbi:hypothetical protein M7I_7164 [Glarea lozoyensis 74030]|uniref:Uncharacterized protein n=1 Tax=Glarea lozoyensis (strain ATCC 74030 / MF5533) TaxID=1104152 RepID=H0EWJ6_GLAL7|nr:hypothetical protein M7I_7164 [Glarea lozoyensis 74030]